MKKKPKKNTAEIKKSKSLMLVLKAVLIILTIIYPLIMVSLTGAGLIYTGSSYVLDREEYGHTLTFIGTLLVASGLAVTLGALLSCIKKNIAAVILSCSGFALCMVMLYKLVNYANQNGWSDKYTMEPISTMYMARIVPVIAPFILATVIAVIQLFSYEEAEKRRIKRQLKEEKENEPSPPIL